MLELIFGVYGLICWLVFKKWKLVPINQWTIVTAILIGVAMMGFLLLLVNMYQPITKEARLYAITTPIVPDVKGRVVEVPVQPNAPLKQGDVLFRIDPTPYQARFDALAAQLTLATQRLADETRLLKRGAGNKYEVDRLQAEVDRLSAQLDEARFNLEGTVVRAPGDGFVTQVTIRPGFMAVPLPLSPAMVFVHAETHLVGGFRQNAMRNVAVGDKVEVAFDSLPGRVFAGKVAAILPVLAEGQVQTGGRLLSAPGGAGPRGRIPVRIEMDDDLEAYNLPAGSVGMATIYTQYFKPIRVMRMIILRIKSWENYIFLP